MKPAFALLAALIVPLSLRATAASLDLVNDPATGGPGRFAAEEIRREAAARGITLGDDAQATRVSLTVGKNSEAAAQGYSIRVQSEGGRRVITVRGADAAGAMYGGLDIAEAIRTGTLDALRDSDHRPHIAQRGIKFNIPLDLRTPSYTDCSDAAQANIPEMWEREFWTAFLDAMARHRYNVLSLWSLHPFPSLVKVPEFPEVALNDVWRTRAKLDDTFSFAGNGMVRPAMLADHEVVKRISIDEKIEFWRWVMQHAADRGKIRGACALALFDASSDKPEHDAALRHLGDALTHWKKYAAIRDTHYVPALYNRVGYVDVTALTEKAAADLTSPAIGNPAPSTTTANAPARRRDSANDDEQPARLRRVRSDQGSSGEGAVWDRRARPCPDAAPPKR